MGIYLRRHKLKDYLHKNKILYSNFQSTTKLNSSLLMICIRSNDQFTNNNVFSNLKFIKFPSFAGSNDWVKLPRQRQVDPEEYKEFLKLGFGDIFNLNLDKVIDKNKNWLDPLSDSTDFFNYGHTLDTWKVFCRRVHFFRTELLHSFPIKIFEKGYGIKETDIDYGRFTGGRRSKAWIPTVLESLNKIVFDIDIKLILVIKSKMDQRSTWISETYIQDCYKNDVIRDYEKHTSKLKKIQTKLKRQKETFSNWSNRERKFGTKSNNWRSLSYSAYKIKSVCFRSLKNSFVKGGKDLTI